MEQKTEEEIQRLQNEHDQLSGKVNALERFMISKDYINISSNQKVCLEKQHEVMKEFKDVVMQRIIYLRYQKKREDSMTKEMENRNGTSTN